MESVEELKSRKGRYGKIIYKPGQRLMNMVFIGEVESSKDRRGMFICTCGKIFTAFIHSVKSNATKSCGCFRSEYMCNKQKTHGLSKHPIYQNWWNMMERCYNKLNKSYSRYGGVGVIVCDEWRNSFKSFYEWCINNGWEYGLQLDKDIIGNGKVYSPDKCCFVTPKQNSNKRKSSRFLEYNEVSMTIAEWSNKTGIKQATISARLKMNWGVEKALSLPLKYKK